MQRSDGHTLINTYKDYIGFRYRNSNKMAIHYDGHVRIGSHSTTHSSHALRVDGGSVYVDSTIYAAGNVVGYYSDRRLKENLNPVTDYKKILNNLTGYRFDWNKDSEGIVPDDCREKSEIGLIAQDVEEVLPEAVHKWKGN